MTTTTATSTTPSDAAPARAWRTVLETIEADLLEGRLGPGDRLASERDLAASLGVGRSSVREAIRVLEVLGLVRTATGSGPSAGAIIIATPRGGMATLLRLQVAAHGFPLEDVLSTRLLLEDAVLGTLAAPDARADLTEVARILDAMDADDLSREDFVALDAQFHTALADASGNVVVGAMMAGLRGAIEAYVQTGAMRVQDWDSLADRLRREHREIVAAVEAGDVETARTRVHAHITGYYATAGLSRD